MDKNAIKKYAVWARTELIERVSKKADEFEVSADADPNADSARGVLLTDTQKKQRAKLISEVKEKGFEQVMEEVAYTWFNRFSALRFMEVNNYLPTRVRVFTDADGAFKPQILTEAIHMELKGLDMEKVYALKEANDDDALFKYLIITQCNALSDVLPGMFQRISDYTELLFPDNLLRDGSVIDRMISDIPEQDWNVEGGGQIEILGWLYQYYISEKHESVVDPLHGKVVSKDEVPAATALFTTDWVVRYIIDNSVGRYWIERHPDSNLKNELEYFVTPKNGIIPTVDEKITPEQLTVLDPSMGSAHFGVYAFEVLEKIYTEYGYTEREAAASIVEHNLFGLDIDDRSAQIAYFAIMMKAMQYDRHFLKRGIQPHFYSIQESNGIDNYIIDEFANGDSQLKKDMESIVYNFKDAKEYGSILQITSVDFDALFARFDEIQNTHETTLYSQTVLDELLPLVEVAKVMCRKYAVVATNPPYLNKYDAKLKTYVTQNYNEYKGDLFSIFIYRNFVYCRKDGYSGFMTPFVWMFIKTYENLRNYVINQKHIVTLIQFEYSAFEEATVPICSFVLKNGKDSNTGYYFRLSDFTGGMEIQKLKMLEAQDNKNCGFYYEANQSNFSTIPSNPIAYWVSNKLLSAFKVGNPIGKNALARNGMKTGDNNKFLRFWWEVEKVQLSTEVHSYKEAELSGKKWFPYNKGGEFRKWYGNNDYVVNWEHAGYEIFNLAKSDGRHVQDYPSELKFKPALTWSLITSSKPAFRYKEYHLSDIAGMSLFGDRDKIIRYLGFLNSPVALEVLRLIAPTINFQAGDIARIPVLGEVEKESEISDTTEKNINLSRLDWDSFETSWDFKRHPLIAVIPKNSMLFDDIGNIDLAECYMCWEQECNERFNQLKANEEELNRIFIDIYGLQDELTPEVEDKDVTVRKADLQRDIRSLISYAVGCMFGRYSLNCEGLAYAGGEWDKVNSGEAGREGSLDCAGKYTTFPADKDNVIPICDDEYFEDDIVNRFVEFIRTVYGEKSLESNLKFIADALGGKGQPRDVIRNYFLNDFYADHLKIYQKRPIYWLFDSGKKNGFKCLIYMHRYQPDTIARIRTDYVHEQQARYRTAIAGLERQITDAPTSERVRLNKQLSKIKDQAEETRIYEEKIHHLADQMIAIDLDDGVKVNYAKFADVLAKIK